MRVLASWRQLVHQTGANHLHEQGAVRGLEPDGDWFVCASASGHDVVAGVSRRGGPLGVWDRVQSGWLFRMPSLHLARAQVAGGGRAQMYERVPCTAGT